MKKTITTTLAVFALGASLAFAAPHDGWKGHEGRHAGFSEKLAAKLDLSDAQRTQIKRLEAEFRTDNAAFLQNFRQTVQDFRAARQANDRAKIDALEPAFDAQRAQMKSLRDAQRAKIRSILTPDQQVQLDALRAQHESRREQK